MNSAGPSSGCDGLTLALAQMPCQRGNLTGNIERMLGIMDQAAAASADVVIFPEMSDTGYDMAAIRECASRWDGGGPFETLCAAAQSRRIHIVAGLSERTDAGIYNSVAVIEPSGNLVARYRKVHLITAAPVFEHQHLLAGEDFVTCQIGGFTVGLMTCYDIRFPEQARALTVAGAELIVVPAAFPLSRVAHWDALIPARAIENQVYVAACNRAGADNGLAFGGHSQVIDPYGCLLAKALGAVPDLIFATVQRRRLDDVRSRLKCLEDRRPILYRSITVPEHSIPVTEARLFSSHAPATDGANSKP